MARPKEQIISEMVDAGFSDDEIRQAFKKQPSNEGIVQKGWNALTLPEKGANATIRKLTAIQSGIQNKAAQLTGLPIGDEPTGNLTRDIIAGTPKLIGEIGQSVVPGFVSRGSIVTGGLLKGAQMAAPLAKLAGKGIAKGAESISGLEYKTPGILTEAASNPKLLFSKGKESAGPVYEKAKELGGAVRETLVKIPEKVKLVKESLKLAKSGQLNPTEALEARKELAGLKKQVTGEFYRKATQQLNEIAKPVFAEADKIYEQGVRAGELRRLFPVNKGGGTSIMKSTLGTIAGVVPAMAMSPLVQGTVATGIGMGARAAAPLVNNPLTTAAVVEGLKLTEEKAKEFLRKARGNRDRARKMAEKEGYEIPIVE